MISKDFEQSSIYNDAEKIDRYWKNLQPHLQADFVSKEKWKKSINFLEQVSFQNSVIVLIWNVLLKRYVFALDKRNICGQPMEAYLGENGVDFSISKMHPLTMDANLIMQQKSFEVFNSLSSQDKLKLVISFDGLYKMGGSGSFHFLQQAICIELDSNGNGILFLSYIHDISHLKKNNTANLVTSYPGQICMWNYNFGNKTLETTASLSRQEKTILGFLSKGKSSKEIADELFISPLTVDTHRRKLLKKTNCIDTTGMITYSKLVGLI
ncbi:MAG: helix-turn-helix transcriptional regulator [Bacteroidetes bacterium]|nr:helix-turn-helix transcriptional regulator [Bacteroidota bacterium]